jgi:hypothetical protein
MVWCATATLTSATGALLLVGLLATATDLSAALGVRSARATARQLPLHDFVEQVTVHLSTEDIVFDVDAANLLAVQIIERESRHVGFLRT